MHANADKMQNDRVLGNILLTKVDLDAARYLAAGSNGDTTLEGAVYDLYAADTIEHPDGVSGVVDYSKTTDANGTPIWHTTVLTNGGWDTDYLPIFAERPAGSVCQKSLTASWRLPTCIWADITLWNAPQGLFCRLTETASCMLPGSIHS